MVRLALQHVSAPQPADLTIRVSSTIPVARGLGSGTAVSTAIVRAVAAYYRKALTSRQVSDLVFEVEKLHHGNPSGIDNTVVAFGKPVFFVRDRVAEIFWVGKPIHLLIADTGVPNPTRAAVEQVRRWRDADPERYDRLFDEISEIAASGRAAIESGRTGEIGELMSRNQRQLREIGVSTPDIDRLVQAAMQAGAWGAKLTGAGFGGHIIALVEPERAGEIAMMLRLAGAHSAIVTEVK
jgi:mevalonate kinase